MPPVFTPNSYAPPLLYTTPSPGDGFGESVASNYGNVAIGAPFENGTGAVYLYDGVTAANAVNLNLRIRLAHPRLRRPESRARR